MHSTPTVRHRWRLAHTGIEMALALNRNLLANLNAPIDLYEEIFSEFRRALMLVLVHRHGVLELHMDIGVAHQFGNVFRGNAVLVGPG